MRSLLTTLFLLMVMAACSRNTVLPADAANGNLAPVDQVSQQTSQPQQPVTYSASSAGYKDNPAAYDSGIGTQLVSAPGPPPPLPEYSQPPCPGDDYIWTPGYWDYSSGGYYWVPGAWVLAPWEGALWTPPYWAFDNGGYRLFAGYWAPTIGFYGGINYGFGYTGRGYYGGYWRSGHFNYNRSVTNISSGVHNVYEQRVTEVNNTRVSFNGGQGGAAFRPTAPEMAVVREHRTAPVAVQVAHERQASQNREQFAAVNRGRPPAVAETRPLAANDRAPEPSPASRMAAQNQPSREPFGGRGAPAPGNPQGNRFEREPLAQQQRPAVQPAIPQRPEPRTETRVQGPESRPTLQVRPAPQPQGRPEEQARPAFPGNRSMPRPEPQARPAAPVARPAPAPRAEPAPAARPEPAARTAPAPRPEPAPAARPAPASAPPGEHKKEGR
jgi:hypothetical protein